MFKVILSQHGPNDTLSQGTKKKKKKEPREEIPYLNHNRYVHDQKTIK